MQPQARTRAPFQEQLRAWAADRRDWSVSFGAMSNERGWAKVAYRRAMEVIAIEATLAVEMA